MANKIRMRVNHDSNSFCSECGIKYKNTKEIYDIMLFGNTNQICSECLEVLFQKILRAQTNYNAKIKTKEDMARIKRSKMLKES